MSFNRREPKPGRKLVSSAIACALDSWWSQTGSNRRPHACKARALPTELWPLLEASLSESCRRPVRPRITQSVVGPGRLELPTSRLSGVCSNHLSYRPLKRHVQALGPDTRSHHSLDIGCSVFRKEKRRRRHPATCVVSLNKPIGREALEVHP
jgi:hypothetical protein